MQVMSYVFATENLSLIHAALLKLSMRKVRLYNTPIHLESLEEIFSNVVVPVQRFINKG